jgi:GDPmannose 4,6-dehydratase
MGLQDCLYIGNFEAKRDWGHARDYVEMQWLMLQQEEPEDFVIATGEQHSVREFVEAVADEMGVAIEWRGRGADEAGFDSEGRCIVRVDPAYFRPTEVDSLLGDAAKARKKLGWAPRISFRELVAEMVRADLQAAQRDLLIESNGFKIHTYQE